MSAPSSTAPRPYLMAVAGAAFSLLAYASVQALRRARQPQPPSAPRRVDVVPPTKWTCRQVCEWLTENGVREATVQLFARQAISGAQLAHMAPEDLIAMGVPPRDVRIIVAALEEALVEVPAAPPAPPRTPVPPPSVTATPRPASVPVPLQSFLNNADNMFSVMVYPQEDVPATDLMQYRLQMASQLYDLLDTFHALTLPEQEAAMLPLSRQLTAIIAHPPTPQRVVGRSEATPTPAIPPAVEQQDRGQPPTPPVPAQRRSPSQQSSAHLAAQLRPLNDMVDSFAVLLQSDELKAIPPAEFAELGERITTQLSRVLRVAAELPPAVGQPLLDKCNAVARLVAERQGETAAPAAPPEDNGSKVRAILTKLRAIFEMASSPDTLNLEPKKRLALVGEMLMDVGEIRATVASEFTPNSDFAMVGDVALQVESVLEQVKQLTEEELAAEEEEEAKTQQQKRIQQKEKAEAEEEEEDAVATETRMASVLDGLETILKEMRAPSFTVSPPDVKATIARRAYTRFTELMKQVNLLPPAEREAVASVAALTRGLLNDRINAGKGGASAAPKASAERGGGDGNANDDGDSAEESAEDQSQDEEEEGDDDEDENDEADQGGDDEGANDDDAKLDSAVKQLEAVFAFLNSPQFMQTPLEQKGPLAAELLRRVRVAKAALESCEGSKAVVDQIMTALVVPVEDLLTNMCERLGPSEQFREIEGTLKEMEDMLSSESFQRADRERKVRAARAIIPELQRITSTFERLSPSEKAAAESLVAPINNRLIRIVMSPGQASSAFAEGNSGGAGPATEEEDGVPTTKQLEARLRKTVDSLQDLSRAKGGLSQRMELISGALKELISVRKDCDRVGPDAAPVSQMADRIIAQLEGIGGGVQLAAKSHKKGEDTAAAPSKRAAAAAKASSPQPRTADPQRQRLFESISDITEELRNSAAQHQFLTDDEIEPLVRLLALVNSAPNMSPEEKQQRDNFAAELQKATDSAREAQQQQKKATPAEAKGKKDNEDAEKGEAKEEDAEEDIKQFISTFNTLREKLGSIQFTSPNQLIPFMHLTERTLTAADARNLQWRTNPPAVHAVSEVLTEIQNVQEKLNTEPRPSSTQRVLQQAAQELHDNPPHSAMELEPYLALLQDLTGMRATFSPQDQRAYEALQDAVVSAADSIHDTEMAAPRSKESQIADSLLEISDKLRDTTMTNPQLDQYEAIVNSLENAVHDDNFTDAIASIREQIRLQRLANNMVEEEEEEESEKEAAKRNEQTGKDNHKTAPHDPQETPTVSKSVAFDEDDNETSTSSTSADSSDGKGSSEEEEQNGESEADIPVDAAPSSTATQQQKKGTASPAQAGEAAAADGEVAIPSPPSSTSLRLPLLSTRAVPGGVDNEWTLLPKIEARVGLPSDQFVGSCTLFDIQNISKVLLHLSTSNKAKSDEALQKRLNAVKGDFVGQLGVFNQAAKRSHLAEAPATLHVTGEDREEEDGQKTRELVIYTEEEADSYLANSSVMKQLQADSNAVGTTTTDAVARSWGGHSVALLVYAESQEKDPEEVGKQSTALSELVLLREVLAVRYGFTVTTVTDPTLTADSMLQLVQDVVQSSSAARVFVYYCSARSHTSVIVPHAMTFHDESVLEHRRVLEVTAPSVERVVVLHCLPQAMEMQCRLGETTSPALVVRMTSKAARVVESIRCWLYDGLFTPATVELLCRDERDKLCPEDLINYVVTTMTQNNIHLGSFIDSPAAAMAFFIPNDEQ